VRIDVYTYMYFIPFTDATYTDTTVVVSCLLTGPILKQCDTDSENNLFSESLPPGYGGGCGVVVLGVGGLGDLVCHGDGRVKQILPSTSP
jgi:hypothetical protein